MLNVALLRKVQESIADTTQPFNMNDWCQCIAGHAYRVITGSYPHYTSMDSFGLRDLRARLGLTDQSLFVGYHSWEASSRLLAIARIEALIASHALGDRVAEPAPPVASAPEAEAKEEELELVGV